MSRDIPVIFSAPMVQALLAGRKTMTRRLAWGKPFSLYDDEDGRQAERMRAKGSKVSGPDDMGTRIGWPPSPWQKVKAGDRLWVRENLLRAGGKDLKLDGFFYAADYGDPFDGSHVGVPSIHMPRWASRLTLIVTATKVERLHDISDDDCFAEGLEPWGGRDHDGRIFTNQNKSSEGGPGVWAFGELWKHLHGLKSWEENPEVVALSLSVIKANIDAPEARAA